MDILNLFAHAGAVITLVAMIVGVSHLLGERSRSSRARDEPYESGEIAVRPVAGSQHVGFYVVALMFLLFDVEVLYLLAWAPVVDAVGWVGLTEVAIFAAVLLLALLYLWRIGALDWGARRAGASASAWLSEAERDEGGAA